MESQKILVKDFSDLSNVTEATHQEICDEKAKRLEIIEGEMMIKQWEDEEDEKRNIAEGYAAEEEYWTRKLDKIRKREVEELKIRLVEAETKLRTRITEFELTIDVANKENICLQQTVKKQGLSLAELQGLYEKAQLGLQMAPEELSRRVQSLQAELDETKSNLEIAIYNKRQAEIHSEELVIRVNELTNINATISSTKMKLEQEVNALASDYDEVSKELKADSRGQEPARTGVTSRDKRAYVRAKKRESSAPAPHRTSSAEGKETPRRSSSSRREEKK